MKKQIIRKEDFPNLLPAPGTNWEEQNVEDACHYLNGLFKQLNTLDGSQLLLPSIAEIAGYIGMPQKLLWEALHHLKTQQGLNLDFQSGYYGSILFTR